jgi:hypothetical protein
MNLYAIQADHSPEPAELYLLADDAQALDRAIGVAARDALGDYGSPTATVYLVASDLPVVGQALATDAPAWWPWAHPGVEQNAAMLEDIEREFSAGP